MSGQTSSAASEKSVPVVPDPGPAIKAPEQNVSQVEIDAQRIRASIARLTSNSIDGLENLTSELEELQKFLKSEVQRVQSEIESAVAGVKIIIETIAPWKSNPAAAASTPRNVRAGPAANIEVGQARR
jgi:hypothetical protein